MLMKREVLADFRRIPGVGKVIAEDLWELGFRAVGELKGQDPKEMYLKHCLQKGMQVDRCIPFQCSCERRSPTASESATDQLLNGWDGWGLPSASQALSLTQLNGMLYVLRCVVYYASHEQHDSELLKWWNWKDRTDLVN